MPNPAAMPIHESEDFFTAVLLKLSRSDIQFLVGGEYGLSRYVGIQHRTKDLDIFVAPEDVQRTLTFCGSLGWHVDLRFPHWLGKASLGTALVDVIFSSGNGVATVDREWFVHARPCDVLGVPVKLVPPEEMIWSKGFVQERERFDGADVLHLIRTVDSLDWTRLLRRFGSQWRVLFAHLVLFGFVYPDQRERIPSWVADELTGRFVRERAEQENHMCNGTLLSREQYLHDVSAWGYQDPRLQPVGRLTEEHLAIWNEDIAERRLACKRM
jgi:hypothetical protein